MIFTIASIAALASGGFLLFMDLRSLIKQRRSTEERAKAQFSTGIFALVLIAIGFALMYR
jgi:hypothetical protein